MPLFNVSHSVTIDYEVEVEGARVRVRRHEQSDPQGMDKTSSVKSSTTSPPNTQHTDRLHSDPLIDLEHPDDTSIPDFDADQVNVTVD